MARRIASRLKITGSLVAFGPLHVGGVDANADVDLALAVNGSGKLYVPGTSLAGPMRAWLRQRVGEDEVAKTWGYQDRSEHAREPNGFASFIIVEDGQVKLPAGTTEETRDGVGIDRVLGAAAEGSKYNRAVLPSGSEIGLEMTVELGEQGDTTRSFIVAALKAMQRGKIRFGAAKTRGLGKVTLKELNICEQQLLTFQGMLDTLRNELHARDVDELGAKELPGLPTLEIKIDWVPRGPLMVRAEGDGVAVDTLPLVSAKGSDLTFVLPGSSIKGALRSQAERIVRTVCGFSAPALKSPRKDFMRQVEMRDAQDEREHEGETLVLQLIGGLFGRAGKAELKDKKIPEAGPPLSGLSALTVEDCYATPRFRSRHWEAIESAPDADADGQVMQGSQSPLRRALQNAGLAEMQQAFHVAIDRWTGGAADGFLYTVLEPHGVAWEPIRLSLDLARLREEDRRPAVMCLLLTLRDLVAGRIPLGFGANRGMGALEVTGIEIAAENLSDELADLKSLKIVDDRLGGWSERLKSSLEQRWKAWVAESTREVAR